MIGNVGCAWYVVAMLVAVVLMSVYAEGSEEEPAHTSPYAKWQRGPSTDPGFFPIAVWLQAPENAPRYKEAGINLYVGLWRGPTREQIDELRRHGMPVICSQNAFGVEHPDEEIIVGWMHGDEPDNAQDIARGWEDLKDAEVKVTINGNSYGKWGPPIPPSRIVADFRRIKVIDPTRPVFLNLGQGVAWNYPGRGVRKEHPEDYPEYVKGCDIVSYDIYPARHNKAEIKGNLWYVPKGVMNLRTWSKDERIVWNCIECNRAGFMDEKPTPEEVRTEVWMSLIHGSKGIVYFVHHFGPFVEAGLFRDQELLEGVTELNRQIARLAPVLNSPTVNDGASASSENEDVPLAVMMKRHEGAIYLFTVGMRGGETRGTFTVHGIEGERPVEVLDEHRTLTSRDGVFEDTFGPYEVHLYRIGEKVAY